MPKRKKELLIAEEELILSKERTILSFMSTALAFIGIGIIVIKIFDNSMVQIIGYLIIAVGFAEVGESIRRLKKKQKLMNRLEKRTGV